MAENLKNFVARTKTVTDLQKDKTRAETVRFICDYFTSKQQRFIQFLTLPSAWWRFENAIVNRFEHLKERGKIEARPHVRFIGCERDWKIFQLAAVHIKTYRSEPIRVKRDEKLNCQLVSNGHNTVLYHTDVFDYIDSAQERKVENDHKVDCMWLDFTCAITSVDERLSCVDKLLNPEAILVITLLKARESRPLPLPRIEYVTSLLEPLGLELINVTEYKDGSPMLHLIYKKTQIFIGKPNLKNPEL